MGELVELGVNKPRDLVEIHNPLSEQQIKAYTCIVKHFLMYEIPEGHDYRSIALTDLSNMMGEQQRNFSFIDKQIEKLQTTLISWGGDAPKKIGKKKTTFFSYTQIIDGRLEYDFHPELQKLLRQKDGVFNRIKINSLRMVGGKYAPKLYQICTGYKTRGSYDNGTPWLTVEKWKKLLCGTDDIYKGVFSQFKRRVLTNSIKEINEHTEIEIEMLTRGVKQKVLEMKFLVRPNPNYVAEDYLMKQPSKTPKEAVLTLRGDKLDGVKQVPENELLSDMQRELSQEEAGAYFKKLNGKGGNNVYDHEEEEKAYQKSLREAEEWEIAYQNKYPDCLPRFDEERGDIFPYHLIEKRFLKVG